MATSKLTLVRSDGFSNINTRIFSLRRVFQPSAFNAAALETSNSRRSGVRSAMERKSLLFKSTSRMQTVQYIMKTGIFNRGSEGGYRVIIILDTEWNSYLICW